MPGYLESGIAIQSYVKGLTREAFVQDRMRYSAVIREFEIIGEAVGKLSAALKDEYPGVPWQDIKDFRNLLAQEYFGVDLLAVKFNAQKQQRRPIGPRAQVARFNNPLIRSNSTAMPSWRDHRSTSAISTAASVATMIACSRHCRSFQ